MTKQAKAVKTETTEVAVKQPSKSKSFAVRFAETLEARNAEQYSKDTVTALNNAIAGQKAIDLVMSKPEFKELQASLLKSVRIADSKQNKHDFIAVKVLVKIVAALTAIGQGLKSELDPYSRTIIANVIALNQLNNKSALVSLSRSVVYDELEQQAALVQHYNCSANTAGTQCSSTRQMLKALDMCEVVKGKRNDIITIKDNARIQAMVALFA